MKGGKYYWSFVFVLSLFLIHTHIPYSFGQTGSGTGTGSDASHIIDLTITAGGTPITEGMVGYCYQSEDPWGFYSTSTNTNGVYSMSVTEGSFTCSAYCDYTYWYDLGQDCPYSGYITTDVTVSSTDSSVSASINFEAHDKTITTTVTAGGEPVTDQITVYCGEQESPWTYDDVSEADINGNYVCEVTSGYYYVYTYCNTWPCDYSGYPSEYVTVSDASPNATVSLNYALKDKTIHMTIMAGDEIIREGMSTYCCEQGGSWSCDYAYDPTGDTYDMEVGEGLYSCSAYCTDWQNCEVSGYPRVEVEFTEDDPDTEVSATLYYYENNATLSGIVTSSAGGVSGAWVSANSYEVSSYSSESTDSATSHVGSTVVKNATVTEIADSSTQVYQSAQTDSSGAFEMRLVAGTYTVWVYPPYDRPDLASTSTEVTVTADGTTTISLSMAEKTAVISGSVTDSNGDGLLAYINGWSYNGVTGESDWFWTETNADGNYTAYGVEGLTYNIMASPNTWADATLPICGYTNEGMQTVVASDTPQTVDFTVPTCNCTTTFNAVDTNGEIVSSIYGSIYATESNADSSDGYFGIWGWMSNGTGTVRVQDGVEYVGNLWFWDNDYDTGGEETFTCSDGAVTVDITLLPTIENALSGTYVDSDGNAVTFENSYDMYVYASKGHTYKSCETFTSGYSCRLSEGIWNVGYWANPESGFASSSGGETSSEVTITSSGGETHDITLLRTGAISVTILDADGNPRGDVWVEGTPYSQSDEGSNDYQHLYNSNWCSTDGDGTCTMNVGAPAEGVEYCVNAYIPYSMRMDEYISMPEEVCDTVFEGETTEFILAFIPPDGTSVITVTEGSSAPAGLVKGVLNAEDDSASIINNATVDCFSSAGGAFSVTTADGIATCPCTTAHSWWAMAYKMESNALYISSVEEITCTEEGGEGALQLDFVTEIPEPDSFTLTDADSQMGTCELSDGFSVSFPLGALGGDGETATCTCSATMTPATSGRQLASFYAYSVSCVDGNGVAITQLNGDATFTVPYNNDQVENMGLTDKSIEMCYHDASTGAYSDIDNDVVEDAEDLEEGETPTISFPQDHLTDFAVVGNGLLGAVQGEDGGAIGTGDDAEEGDAGTEDGSSATDGGGCGCDVTGKPTPTDAWWVVLLAITMAGYSIYRKTQLKPLREKIKE